MHLSALVGTFLFAATGIYSITVSQNSTGQNFFDDWTFINGTDTNSGNVLYVNRDDATAKGLIQFTPSGNAIIKVDNITNGVGNMNFGRLSVQLQSNNSIGPGSLIVMDAAHLPFGCSVWPAVFAKAPNWPIGGEIDIVENVNLRTNNQYSLHTTQGCQHPPNSSTTTSSETGTLISTDCFNQTLNNEGCVVEDASTNSFGQGFNTNGGGVYAMLWDATGIKTWFFDRSSIPSDVSTQNPNPANWGTPAAFYPQSDCNTNTFFTQQFITIQIDICGSFAIGVFNENGLCPGDCLNYVGVPTNYDDAYFEFSYFRVFTGFSTLNASSPSQSGGTAAPPSQTGGAVTLSPFSTSVVAVLLTLCAGIILPAALNTML